MVLAQELEGVDIDGSSTERISSRGRETTSLTSFRAGPGAEVPSVPEICCLAFGSESGGIGWRMLR